jgi:Na+-transporting methylmalonyl-CoA/oxaloacetate decarboxylase gamma subunit
MTELQAGVQLMLYGLCGTFTVLILFFIMIKLILKLFPEKEKPEE